MKVMDDSFDDELRRRLRQFSEEPEESLWHSISAKIETIDRAKRLQKKTRIGWIFIFTSIMIGGFLYLLDPGPKTDRSILAVGVEQRLEKAIPRDGASKPGTKLLQPQPDEMLAEIERPMVIESTKHFKSITTGLMTDLVQESRIQKYNGVENESNQNDEIAELNTTITQEAGFDSTNLLSLNKPVEVNDPVEVQPDDSDLEQTRNGLSIYFTVMPTLGYQRIEPNSNDNLIVESIERISTFSADRLGVRAELGVEYPIANRIHVFGGLVYFQRQQTIGYTQKVVSETEVSQGPDGEIILQPEFSYESKSFEYDVRNLGLQIGLSYQLAKRKFLQTVGTGIEFHVALNKFNDTPEFTNNPSAYIFYNLYYRIQYPTETKLRAVVQPTLNYSFYINQNRDAPFYVKPYGLGLNIGFTYNLNR